MRSTRTRLGGALVNAVVRAMNTLRPISEEELSSLVESHLQHCAPEERSRFEKIRVPLRKVPIHRLGALEEVFVVAECCGGVIYYEDVEEGFEFSAFGPDGAIPVQGCNQLELKHVLARLKL